MIRETHCNGCGTHAGQPRVTYRNKRTPDQGWIRIPVHSEPVTLTPIQFLDYGERWLCAHCREEARRHIARVTGAMLTIGSGA